MKDMSLAERGKGAFKGFPRAMDLLQTKDSGMFDELLDQKKLAPLNFNITAKKSPRVPSDNLQGLVAEKRRPRAKDTMAD